MKPRIQVVAIDETGNERILGTTASPTILMRLVGLSGRYLRKRGKHHGEILKLRRIEDSGRDP